MRQFAPLQSGDTIGVIATGSPVEQERFEKACRTVKNMGFRLRYPIDPSAFYARYDHGFSNGAAADRVDALYNLIEDEEVKVILTARGGYGSMDMLPLLDFSRVAASGTPLIGMSDACALLLPWSQKAKTISIHGPGLATSFADYDEIHEAKKSADALISLLSDPLYSFSENVHVVRAGNAEGPIIVSNLTILTSLLGTPWDVDTSGAILMLEEVGSRPFQVHRCLMQLKLAGKFDQIAGLAFGRFSRCEAAHGPSVDEVLEDLICSMLGDHSFPIVSRLTFGHWGENHPLPLSAGGRINEDLFSLVGAPVL